MRKLNIFKNDKGVAAIEMAIVLPILLLIIAAVIEFGLYFFKSQIAARTVSTAAIAIQMNPAEPSIQATARNNGLSIMDFNTLPNFVCAKSYATNDLAKSGKCVAGEWTTTAPQGVAVGAPYYVAVRVFALHTPLTPLRAMSGAFPPDIEENVVAQVNVIQTAQKGIALLTSPVGSSGSWTVPDGVTQVKATIVGGGGGSEQNSNDGGGGSGATIIAYFKNLTSGSSISYTIGAGGGITKTVGGTTRFNNIAAGGGGFSVNCGWANSVAGDGGTAASGQTPSHGTISSIALFPGTHGVGCYGGATSSGVPYYGTGGGPDYPGKQGAVILEW
jgi:Flp pilus assembly protein TadG